MKQAVVQVEHTSQFRAEGLPVAESVLTANRNRFRPILMTTLTLVAGMALLVLGAGAAAEERRAVVVIGGLSLSLFLTLLVVPVAYAELASLRPETWPKPP